MTAKEKNENVKNLRLRGCLLSLRKLDPDNPADVKLTLARIRRTLEACQPTSTRTGRGGADDKLVREIIKRTARLAAQRSR